MLLLHKTNIPGVFGRMGYTNFKIIHWQYFLPCRLETPVRWPSPFWPAPNWVEWSGVNWRTLVWAKHVRHLMAKSSGRKWSGRRLDCRPLEGPATLTECSMDTEHTRFSPLPLRWQITIRLSLRVTYRTRGLHLGSVLPLYNQGATSQFFPPPSPHSPAFLGQTKQLMACKLKQRLCVCGGLWVLACSTDSPGPYISFNVLVFGHCPPPWLPSVWFN